MNAHDRLDQLIATVRNAKTMPMSTSCLVNRAEVLDGLNRLRNDLPNQDMHADAVMPDRQAVLAAVRAQSERIMDGAHSEREKLIEQTDVLVEARARAASVTTQARAESTRLLADADGYVDSKLAEFETLLDRLSSQVNNGRLRLTARREADLARLQTAGHPKAGENLRPADVLAAAANA